MDKEYIAGEPQRYEIGGRVFIVEPRYRKDGESMADILLKLMFADLDEEMRATNKTETVEKVVERRDTERKIVTKETQEGCLSFLIIRSWNFFKVS